MKYLLPTMNGYELREDQRPPANAVPLTDAQYSGLANGSLLYQNGQIVTNPTPPKL